MTKVSCPPELMRALKQAKTNPDRIACLEREGVADVVRRWPQAKPADRKLARARLLGTTPAC